MDGTGGIQTTGNRRLFDHKDLTKPSEDVMVTTEPLQTSVFESEGESMEELRSITVSDTCVDRAVIRVRTSTWLTCEFVLIFIVCLIFAGLLLHSLILDQPFAETTLWLVLLSVAVFILGIAAVLTQMNEAPNELGFDFLQIDNNSIRVFELFEVAVEVTVGAILILQHEALATASALENAAVAFPIAAIPFASTAAVMLVIGAVMNQVTSCGSAETRWKLMPVAMLLNDTAILLILARFVVTQVVSVVEVMLFVMFIVNVCLPELNALTQIRTEDSRRLEVGMSSYESDASLQQSREERRKVNPRNPRRALRDEATLQSSLPMLFVFPIVVTVSVSIRHTLDATQIVAILLPPFLVLAMVMGIILPSSNAMTWCEMFFIDLRDLLPRMMLAVWWLVLANVPELLPLEAPIQQAVFMSAALYMLLPAVLRLIEDFTRGRKLVAEVTHPRQKLSLKARLTAFELLCIVADRVKGNEMLKQLDVADNAFSARVARAVRTRLLDECNMTRISMLHVPSLRAGERSLMLSQTWIDDFHATLLAALIQDNIDVVHLYLSSNEIGAAGAEALAEAFTVHESLQLVNLLGNRIGNNGARAISQCLKTNAGILKLNLSANCIGPKGGKFIGIALASNHTLRELNLRDNNLGSEGAAGIAAGLGINDSVEELSLASNGISDEGGQALIDAVRINETLKALQLARNVFSRDMKTTMRVDRRMQV